jgi:hypothetical protein
MINYKNHQEKDMSEKEVRVEISQKSTKDQILSAYNEILAQLEEKKFSKPEEEKKKEDQIKLVEKASKKDGHAIITELGSLKINVSKQLDLGNLIWFQTR